MDFHANPVANSLDGYGTAFPQASSSFDTFGVGGRDEETPRTLCNFLQAPGNFLNAARIGFAISSPQLLLAGGKRVIELKVKGLADILNAAKSTNLGQILDIWLTGEKGWINVPINPNNLAISIFYESFDQKKGLRIHIDIAEQKIIPFDPELHPGDLFPTNAPVLKVQIKNLDEENFSTAVPRYEDLVIDSGFSLRTIVGDLTNPNPENGLKDLLVQNAMQVVENGKTFFAFTQMPTDGSPLYVGSVELFTKNIGVNYKVHIKWMASIARPKLDLSCLINKTWLTAASLLADNTATDNSTLTGTQAIDRVLNLIVDEFNSDSESGFFKIFPSELPSSPIATVAENGLLYQAEYVSLEYDSTLDFNSLTPGVDQFFHLYPFGFVPVFPAKNLGEVLAADALTGGLFVDAQAPETETNPRWYLFPQFFFGQPTDRVLLPEENRQYNQAELQTGHLILGIEALAPPQNLSLLFKFEEGTQADDEGTPPQVHWSYLTNNEWRPLPSGAILNDDTFELQTTGVILFSLPKDINAQNSLLPEGQFWLCASVSDNPDRFPRLVAVHAQAVTAIYDDQEGNPAHYELPLSAGSISGLKGKVDAVKSVKQPYESFGGRPADKGPRFYMEASERIRHKGRAITVWDYEHLVLSHFPAVFKVKAIPVTDPDCICRKTLKNPCRPSEVTDDNQYTVQPCAEQLAPGHVLLVAIPDFRNRVGGNRLQPKNSNRVLQEIERELSRRTPPYVKVYAKNPVYEEVLVAFRVQFHEGVDKGVFLRKLNEALVQYLTPWAFEDSVDVRFDGRIYASDVINFIEERPYVDFITDFRMFHCKDSCCAPEEEPFTEIEGEVVNENSDPPSTPIPQALVQILGTNLQIATDEYGKFKIPLAIGDRIIVSKNDYGTRILRYGKIVNPSNGKVEYRLIDEADEANISIDTSVGFRVVLTPGPFDITVLVKDKSTGEDVKSDIFYLDMDGTEITDADNAALGQQFSDGYFNNTITIQSTGYSDKTVVLGKPGINVKLYPKVIDLHLEVKVAGMGVEQLIDNASIYDLEDESKQAEKQLEIGQYNFKNWELGHLVIVSAEGFVPRVLLITADFGLLEPGATADDNPIIKAQIELLPDCQHHLDNTDELIEFWEKMVRTYYPTVRGMELSVRPCTSRSILVSAAQHLIELYEPEPEQDPCAPAPVKDAKFKPKPGRQSPSTYSGRLGSLYFPDRFKYSQVQLPDRISLIYYMNEQIVKSLQYLITKSWVFNSGFTTVLNVPNIGVWDNLGRVGKPSFPTTFFPGITITSPSIIARRTEMPPPVEKTVEKAATKAEPEKRKPLKQKPKDKLDNPNT
ncbi:MAG: hypothetical protein KDC61_02220 [Saprospiraceae bacterium]|nr:hypothetical protein [Saprospiraceae bacterium]